MILHQYIDHTLLKAMATQKDIAQLCEEAIENQFFAVCVNGVHTAFAKAQLIASSVKLATVVGFPLGASKTLTKVFETQQALQDGSDEIDMLLNIGALKEGNHSLVREDIRAIRRVSEGKILKVIFENCYLSDEEKRIACGLCPEVGVDFVKTSTGFGSGGATIADVLLMKEEVGDAIEIKASGGIKDRETALKFINAGATRIGTSSGKNIIK